LRNDIFVGLLLFVFEQFVVYICIIWKMEFKQFDFLFASSITLNESRFSDREMNAFFFQENRRLHLSD
jgi:hypothetical protein